MLLMARTVQTMVEQDQELVIRAIDTYLKRHGISIVDGKVFLPKNFAMDTSYMCMWSVNDFENTVKKLIQNTNTGRLPYDQYFNYLTRIYNDQSVVLDKNTTLEPLEIGRKKDRITFLGVRNILLNWIGVSQPALQYGAIGKGAGTSSYGIQQMFNEINRVPINPSNNGSIGLRGETLFANVSFSSGLEGFTATEGGLSTGLDPTTDGLDIYIQFDAPDQKPHVLNNDVPQYSTSVNFCTL